MHLKLVSFSQCPFVQRSVITLKYKKKDFDIEYIDLANKPDWFLKMSPLGKVPILQVDGKDVLFESAVINEYLDEVVGEPTLSRDPLKRAKERAWIEYASPLLMLNFKILHSEDPYELVDELFDRMEKLEDVISDSGFFKESFSIMDSSYAPVFFRMQYFSFLWNHERFEGTKIKKWAENLMAQEYVQDSVRDSFKDEMKESLKSKGLRAYDLMDT